MILFGSRAQARERRAGVGREAAAALEQFAEEQDRARPRGDGRGHVGARLSRLLDTLMPDAEALGCAHWLEALRNDFIPGQGDAEWLRARRTALGNLNDVVREASQRWLVSPAD